MKYQFNFKLQAMYGIITFIAAFVVIYLFSQNTDWISPSIIGLFNFAVSGYYIKNQRCS
jgi:hypothetical protein